MKIVLAGVVLGALAGSAQAAEVAVFPPATVNLTAGQADAVATVCAQTYALASASEVIPPRVAGAALDDTGDHVAAAGKLGLKEFIDVSVVGLIADGDDNRLIIQTVRRTASGEVLYKAQMTAASMGDVEVVCERLSQALIKRVPPDKTLTVDTVTRREATPANRVASTSVRGIKVQMMQPVASGYTFDTMVAIGFDGRFEGSMGFLEVGAGAVVPRDSGENRISYGGLYAEVGGSLYLAKSSASPYVGLGLIPRLVLGGGNVNGGGANVSAYAQAGVMLFREWRSRMYIDVRVSQSLMSLRRQDSYGYYGTPVKGGEFYPTEIGLQIGIGW